MTAVDTETTIATIIRVMQAMVDSKECFALDELVSAGTATFDHSHPLAGTDRFGATFDGNPLYRIAGHVLTQNARVGRICIEAGGKSYRQTAAFNTISAPITLIEPKTSSLSQHTTSRTMFRRWFGSR